MNREPEIVMHIDHDCELVRRVVSTVGYTGSAYCDRSDCIMYGRTGVKRIDDITYHCAAHRYDLHPACVVLAEKLVQELDHSSHHHTLTRVRSEEVRSLYYIPKPSLSIFTNIGIHPNL